MTSQVETGGATITVRLIRSFEHRNIKHVVYQNIDLKQTGHQLIDFIKNDIHTRPGLPPPFRKFAFDTLKIQHKAFGAKSSDPVINTECDEELLIDPGTSLADAGVENETEISFFHKADYLKYQANPTSSWQR